MKLIDKDKVVAEIERWINLLTNEKNQECISQIDKLCVGVRIAELQEVKVFLDTLEVKEVASIWNDARKTIPEDSSNQILCIKEDGLAVLTIGKIVNGTIKWAYLNDLVDTNRFNVEVEESDLNPIFEEMGVEPDSKIAIAFRNAFYKGIDNFCKKKEV